MSDTEKTQIRTPRTNLAVMAKYPSVGVAINDRPDDEVDPIVRCSRQLERELAEARRVVQNAYNVVRLNSEGNHSLEAEATILNAFLAAPPSQEPKK